MTEDPFLQAGFSQEEAKELRRVYERWPLHSTMSERDFARAMRKLYDSPSHKIHLSELLEPEEIDTLREAVE